MTRKLKMLGMALVAVLALTAVSASAASAEKSYTSSSYPTTGTAESVRGTGIFHTDGGDVRCKAHFGGTLSASSSDVTVTPTYTECEAWFAFITASVTGCKYTFTTPKTTGKADEFTAAVDLISNCVIAISTCEVKVEPQGPLSTVNLTNDTAAGDMTVKANVTGITYNVTKDGLGCPLNGTGVKTGGTYTQVSAVTFDAVSPSNATIDVG